MSSSGVSCSARGSEDRAVVAFMALRWFVQRQLKGRRSRSGPCAGRGCFLTGVALIEQIDKVIIFNVVHGKARRFSGLYR